MRRTSKTQSVEIRLPLDLVDWIRVTDGEGNRTKTIIKALRRYKDEYDRRVNLPIMLNKEMKALNALKAELNSWGINLNQLARKVNQNEDVITRQGIEKDIHDMRVALIAATDKITATIAYWRFA